VRLITLLGTGGTGKTRLAVQVAADVLPTFPDGVFVVNLAPITDPALVPSAIAQEVGVHEGAGRPVLESLQTYVRHKEMLLVLDNFEQVVEAARSPPLSRHGIWLRLTSRSIRSATRVSVRWPQRDGSPP
jgi:predicted ATPase